ncbi:MAG: recombinase family protein [Aquisalinus sp.]|nr:recombinase family protein [Aquisalinus sp.]
MPKKVGYARVSTDDQNLDLQINALLKAGVPEDNIWGDKKSGRDLDREELQYALAHLSPGDTLVVWKLDRLGRSVVDILNLVERFKQDDITLVSLTEGIDASTPAGRFVLTMLANLAQMERELTAERTKAGMAARKAAGKPSGRRPVITAADWAFAIELANHGVWQAEVARQLTTRRIERWRKALSEKKAKVKDKPVDVEPSHLTPYWSDIKAGEAYYDRWRGWDADEYDRYFGGDVMPAELQDVAQYKARIFPEPIEIDRHGNRQPLGDLDWGIGEVSDDGKHFRLEGWSTRHSRSLSIKRISRLIVDDPNKRHVEIHLLGQIEIDGQRMRLLPVSAAETE